MEESEGGLQDFDFEQGLENPPTQGGTQHRGGWGGSANGTQTSASQGGGAQPGGSSTHVRLYRKNFRQTVCRHWLRGLCMKGNECGFLHQYDKSRMPVCRFFAKWGECREPDCIYKHTNEDIKECNMYKLGFCPNGPECRYRHQKQPGPPPPPETHLQRLQHRIFPNGVYSRQRYSDGQDQGDGQGLAQQDHRDKDSGSAGRRAAAETGVQGSQASFRQQKQQLPQGSQVQKQLAVGQSQEQPPPSQTLASSAALPLPSGSSRYFIVKSNNTENLELSVSRGLWATHRNNEIRLNEAYDSCDNIILIFSVNETRHFQGCAKMMSKIGGGGVAAEWKYANGTTANYGRNFRIKWLKLCQLSFQKTRHLRNPYKDDLPVKISRDCQELEPSVGEQLARLLYLEPDSELMTVARASEKQRDEELAKNGSAGHADFGETKIVPFEDKDAEDGSDEYEEEEEEADDRSRRMGSQGPMGGGQMWPSEQGGRGRTGGPRVGEGHPMGAAMTGNGFGGMPADGFGGSRAGAARVFPPFRPPGPGYANVRPDFSGPEFPGHAQNFGMPARNFPHMDFSRPDFPPARQPFPGPEFAGPDFAGPGFSGPDFVPRPDYPGNGFAGPGRGFAAMGAPGPGMPFRGPGPNGAFPPGGPAMMGPEGPWGGPGMMGGPGPGPYGGPGRGLGRAPYMMNDGLAVGAAGGIRPPSGGSAGMPFRPPVAGGRGRGRDTLASSRAKRQRTGPGNEIGRPGRRSAALSPSPSVEGPRDDAGEEVRGTETRRRAKREAETGQSTGFRRKFEEEGSTSGDEGPQRSRQAQQRNWEEEEDEEEVWDDGTDIVDPWEAARQAENAANAEGGDVELGYQ